MAVMLHSVTIRNDELERTTRQISMLPKLYEAAARRARMKVRKSVIDAVAKKGAELYYLTPAKIKATASSIESSDVFISFTGRRHGLEFYNLRWTPPHIKGRRANGLTGAVMRAGGLKHIPHGFFARIGGKDLAFERNFTPRRSWGNFEGVERMWAPAIPQLIGEPAILETASEVFNKEFDSAFKKEMLKEIGAVK